MYERYRRLRDEAGMTDYAVSKATGINRSTFTDWRQGKSVPKNEKLQKICALFGVSMDYLVNGAEEEPEHYYTNPKAAEIAQAVFDDPDLMLLFEAARDVKPENIRLAAEMLRRFKDMSDD